MKSLFVRCIFIAIAVLSASAIFSPLRAQAVYSIQHYETAHFTIDFMARGQVEAELRHDVANDGTPFTSKSYSQASNDGNFFFLVEEFEYTETRGDDTANMDIALNTAYKTFVILKDYPISDRQLSGRHARQRNAVVKFTAQDDTAYLIFTRIMVRGNHMWLVSVIQDRQSSLSPEQTIAFFDSFKLED